MLGRIAVENYRGIKRLETQPLSRVNLLVGMNNSGKTSLLECIQLLSSSWPLRELVRIARRRGELSDADEARFRDAEVEVKHFFYGHALQPESFFRIHDSTDGGLRMSCEIKEIATEEGPQTRLFDDAEEARDAGTSPDSTDDEQLALVIQTSHDNFPLAVPLSTQFGIRDKSSVSRRLPHSEFRDLPPVNMISTESLDNNALAAMWDQIALTPEEGQVTEALRILEPEIERIAFLSGRSPYRTGGIVVKLANHPERIPLGSLGDGVRRLLALSFAAVRSAGGVLLIDEIDTGLHYSVMADMWRVLVRTAERMNVQVFATTHSKDCVEGLAALYESNPAVAHLLTLQRIERGACQTTAYTAEDIAYAARRHIEVR